MMGVDRPRDGPPPDLPLLELREWVLTHPQKAFYPDEPFSDSKVPTTVGLLFGLEALGHFVEALEPIGWLHIGYELLEGFIHQAELAELPEKREAAQRAAWNDYMWDKFWKNETAYQSTAAREAAFDRLIGDQAGHAMVPPLTQGAEAERWTLIHRINDRWLEKTDTINGLAHRLETLEKEKPDLATSEEHKRNVAQAAEIRHQAEELRKAADSPNPTRWVKDPNSPNGGYEVGVDRKWALQEAEYRETQARNLENQVQQSWAMATEHARSELESHKAALTNDMKNDVKTVTDFDTNPAHWDLTPDQRALLTCETSSEPQETPVKP